MPPVTTTVKKAKPEKAEPSTAAPKKAAVKPQKAAGSAIKPVPTQPAVKSKKAANSGSKPVRAPVTVDNPPSTLPLEDITDLLDSLSREECVRLSRRVVACISSLPTGADRHTAVLKTVILFFAGYGTTL
jgi:hypothetical protein